MLSSWADVPWVMGLSTWLSLLPGPMGGQCGHQAEGSSSAAFVFRLPQSKTNQLLQDNIAILQESILVSLRRSLAKPYFLPFPPCSLMVFLQALCAQSPQS
jgi:hypothetical protein